MDRVGIVVLFTTFTINLSCYQAVPKLREALGLAPHGSREKASIQQNLDEVVKALDMDPTTRSFPALSLLW